MKRPEKQSVQTPNQVPSQLGQFGKCASLVEHLAHDAWDDGQVRQRSTITLFIEDGLFKLCLNDREAESSLFVTADSFDECIKKLEKKLNGSEAPDWRPWKKKKGR